MNILELFITYESGCFALLLLTAIFVDTYFMNGWRGKSIGEIRENVISFYITMMFGFPVFFLVLSVLKSLYLK